jgi:hypothetical protein
MLWVMGSVEAVMEEVWKRLRTGEYDPLDVYQLPNP